MPLIKNLGYKQQKPQTVLLRLGLRRLLLRLL